MMEFLLYASLPRGKARGANKREKKRRKRLAPRHPPGRAALVTYPRALSISHDTYLFSSFRAVPRRAFAHLSFSLAPPTARERARASRPGLSVDGKMENTAVVWRRCFMKFNKYEMNLLGRASPFCIPMYKQRG